MEILSMTAILSLSDQYSFSSFCTFTFVDGQLWSTYYERILKCSLATVVNLISSAVMQSGMSVWQYYIDDYAHAWYFTFFSLIVPGQPIFNEWARFG